MYSKVYRITCGEGQDEALMSHYDAVITPAIRESEYHVGHQMVEIDTGKWILVSNYRSAQAAEDAASLVRELVGPMAERFGMQLDVLAEGETIREVS